MYVANTFSFVFSASRTYKKVILYGYNQRYWNTGEKYFENGETKRSMYICVYIYTHVHIHAYIHMEYVAYIICGMHIDL